MVDDVSDDELYRYCQICGFSPDGPVPATYPHILTWRPMFRLMRSRDFPLPLIGLVHIANVIDQRRALSTQDSPRFSVRWENLRDHERGRAVDVLTEATVDDEVIWRERSAYLRRSKAAARPAPPVPPEPAEPLPTRQIWRVGPDTATAYARVSGDRNPIHTSAVVARLFGFPGRIAHGMWSLARCLAALEADLPPAYLVDVSFKLPIVLPADVAFAARGSTFELRDARTGRPHLAGRVDASQL